MKLEERMKQMKINEIDVKSKVIKQVSTKSKPSRLKTVLLVAACVFLMVSVVYAATEIFINDDGTYTIQTNEKKWERGNHFEVRGNEIDKYMELSDVINDMAREDDKDYIGYYFSEEIKQPMHVYFNSFMRFSDDEVDVFKEKYDIDWVEVVFENMPEDYDFKYAIAQEMYTDEYIEEWYKKASKEAVKGELYVEEPTEDKTLYAAQLSFRNHHETYTDKLTAVIALESTRNSNSNDILSSEVIDILGYQAVYSELTNDYKNLELEFQGNLIGIHGSVEGNPKEVMVEILSSILEELD